jgi:DNA-binding CsgD family transcriptional regulator
MSLASGYRTALVTRGGTPGRSFARDGVVSPQGSGLERRARPVRRGSPGVLLHPRDLVLLGWLAEQYAATSDQVAVLLGCGPRSVQRVLARLRDAGLVSTQRVLVGQPAWVTPTRAGLRTCGSQYKLWQPKLGVLLHTEAVNDVRLHIQARSPDAEWVSERALARDRRAGEHLPDGLVITAGQRVAVEVELTVKSDRRVRAILDELTARFDMVLYYCPPATHRQLSALRESGSWPTLGVRELPQRGTPGD